MLYKCLNNNELNKKTLKELFDLYLNQSFGIIRQKEIDLFIFLKLIEIGYLKKDVFDIVSKLKITKQKKESISENFD